MQAIYTYGKSLDTMSNAQTLTEGAFSPQDNDNVIETQNFPFQRGRSDFDIRQQFQAAGTWDVPHNYSSAVVRSILGGWQFGGKFIGQTGIPFTVYTGAAFVPICSGGATLVNGGCPDRAPRSLATPAAISMPTARITICPTCPIFGRHLSGQSKSRLPQRNLRFTRRRCDIVAAGLSINRLSALGQEGNLGRNTYDQPGYKDMDFTFEKYFNASVVLLGKDEDRGQGRSLQSVQRSNLWTD